MTILAPSNLAATMAEDASTLYARNVHALLQLLLPKARKGEGARRRGPPVDTDDEVIAGALLTHGGRDRPRSRPPREVTQ